MPPRKYVSIAGLLDEFSLDETGPGFETLGEADLFNDRTARAPRHRTSRRAATKPGRRNLSPQQYINISCRFVVQPGTPLPSPDEVVDPNFVLRIVAEPTGCPICLETATVPRMLSCGHIMCLPCFFRFLRHAEERVCPVCGEPVPRKVTNVSFLPDNLMITPVLGEQIALDLVARSQQGFPLPVRVSETLTVRDQLRYARIVAGTEEYCRSEASREVRDLETAKLISLETCGDDEGYDEALAACRADIASASKTVVPLNLRREGPTLPLAPQTPAYYYYETAFESSTTFVLAPLDIAVLKAGFGEYSEFPPLVVPNVDNVVYKTLDEDIRKRMKFLAYVPLDAPIGLLECDWRGIVPDAVLRKFGKQLSERRKKRKTQDRRDDKRRQKAEAESDSRMRAEVLVDATPSPQTKINLAELPTLGARPAPVAREAKWVDSQAEFDEMMANAYVTKRGRRKIILSSNH